MTNENNSLNDWIEIPCDVTPQRSVKFKRNWLLKNTWKAKSKTRYNLARMKVGSCDCCEARFTVFWHDAEREKHYFQSADCAARFVAWDWNGNKLSLIYTGYGSSYDGFVFIVNDPSKFKTNSNVCDSCLSKAYVEGVVEYFYDYSYKRSYFNPKFEALFKSKYSEDVEPAPADFAEGLLSFAKTQIR